MEVGMDIILPIIGGIIGSTVTILWSEIKNKDNLPASVKWRYIWLGGISGFVAVNLLNPDGHFSEKAPLSILAGISPMSFLKGQAISDGVEEGETFQNYFEMIESYTELFEEEIEIREEEDPEIIVDKVKKDYNIKKGDEEDE